MCYNPISDLHYSPVSDFCQAFRHKKYLKDPDLLARADKLKKEGKCAHQLFCKEDWNLKRWLWYIRSQLNYYRKTARYYGNKGLRD